MTHVWFDAERKKELKKLQMSNPSPETQNLSTYFPSSTDTDPQRGGPCSGCVSLCVSLMLHSCHTAPYE